MLRRVMRFAWAGVGIVLVAGLAAAQGPEPGTVSGGGSVTVPAKPSRLRVMVQVQGSGKSLELAMERLKARREAALGKLATLKAEKESIVIGNPTVAKTGPGGRPLVNGAVPAPPAVYAQPVPYAVPPSTFAPPAPPSLEPVPDAPARPPIEPDVRPSLPPREPPATPAPTTPTPATPPPASSSSTLSVPALPATPRAVVTASAEIAPAVPAGTTPSPYAPPPSSDTVPVTPTPPTYTPAPSGYLSPPSAAPAVRPAARNLTRLFTVSVTLTAEWPLEAETLEQILPAAEALQEKIIGADLPGSKVGARLSPEEQELLEESQGGSAPPSIPGPYGSGPVFVPDAPMPPGVSDGGVHGGPVFVYVAVLSDAQRKKALADAFVRAKAQAQELAEATGAKLGPVTSLNRNVSSPSTPTVNFAVPVYPGVGGSKNENECLAADPASLEFNVQVFANFRLQ